MNFIYRSMRCILIVKCIPYLMILIRLVGTSVRLGLYLKWEHLLVIFGNCACDFNSR